MLKTKIGFLLLLCLVFLPALSVYGWVCTTSGEVVLCDNVTTYIDTKGNEFPMGTITFSDGVNEITILDRNLGAKNNDIARDDSNGYYFQWGNNYGFDNIGDLNVSSGAVNAWGYTRNKPYVNGMFITSNMNRSSVDNRDLWGGGGDNADNDYGMDANNWYMRQGPCPAGYHVPSEGEVNKLFTLWYNKVNGGDKDIHNINIFRMDESLDIMRTFRLPPSGERRYIDASFVSLGTKSYLWTSTPGNINREDLKRLSYIVAGDSYAISSQRLDERAWGINIRCFKDEYKGNVKIITLNYETNGGPKVQSQALLKGSVGYLPGYEINREGYKLQGWYFDKFFEHPFDPDEKLNEDTTLYAKWEKSYVSVETAIIPPDSVTSVGIGDEFQLAYAFAYKNRITTKNNIKDANMSGKMTRIAMAKMLSQYAINVLGKEPDSKKICSFSDVTMGLDVQFDNGVTLACQLGIMGVGMREFRPNDIVTRAEFGAALSRMLYGLPDGVDNYYTTHLNKLYREGIITNTDPKIKELRGYVMIMLMRAADKVENLHNIESENATYLAMLKKAIEEDNLGTEEYDFAIKGYYYNNCKCPNGFTYLPEWVTYYEPGCEYRVCNWGNCVTYVTSFANKCINTPDIGFLSSWIPMNRKEVENYYMQNCMCPIGFDFVSKSADTYADSCDRKYCADAECKEIKTWHIWVKDLCAKV